MGHPHERRSQWIALSLDALMPPFPFPPPKRPTSLERWIRRLRLQRRAPTSNCYTSVCCCPLARHRVDACSLLLECIPDRPHTTQELPIIRHLVCLPHAQPLPSPPAPPPTLPSRTPKRTRPSFPPKDSSSVKSNESVVSSSSTVVPHPQPLLHSPTSLLHNPQPPPKIPPRLVNDPRVRAPNSPFHARARSPSAPPGVPRMRQSSSRPASMEPEAAMAAFEVVPRRSVSCTEGVYDHPSPDPGGPRGRYPSASRVMSLSQGR